MDEYKATLESVGDAIIQWADPESQFTGFTKVRDDGNDIMFERLSVLIKERKISNCMQIANRIDLFVMAQRSSFFRSNPILKTCGV